MSKVIYKYRLEPDGAIFMPKGAKILTVQTQRDESYLWAMVDPEAPAEQRIFRSVPTGMPFDERGMEYIGTFQIHGSLVLHVFEDTSVIVSE